MTHSYDNQMGFMPGPRRSALVFGIASLVVLIAGFAFLIISNEIVADAGYAIVAVLIMLPLILILGALLGATAIILAIVTAVKSQGRSKSWIASLILGLLSVFAVPLALVFFFTVPG